MTEDMKFLGIDHGSVRIGVAISDPTGTLARPLQIVRHSSRLADAITISALASDHDCDAIVVGLPLDSDGSIGPRARSINRFIEELKNQTTLTVIPWDESHSTKYAQENSIDRGEGKKKRQQAIDDRAAAVILQDFLDHRCPNSTIKEFP